MSNVRDHRDLRVWQAAIELGIQCYEVSRTFPREERYGLTAQIRSAAVSVAANIAEGNGRLTIGEYLNHLSNARGSLREIDTHLELLHKVAAALLERETLTREDIEVLRRGEQLPPRTPTMPPPPAPATLIPSLAEPRRVPPIIGGPEPSPA